MGRRIHCHPIQVLEAGRFVRVEGGHMEEGLRDLGVSWRDGVRNLEIEGQN